MGDNDYGDALLPVEVGEHIDYLFAGAAVQIAGGLVGQEDGGFFNEGAGYADTLLLSAGEFCGAVAHPVAEADALQGLPGALTPMSAARPVEQGKLHVGQGAEAGQQVVGLEDEADFPVANVGQLVVAQRSHVLAVQGVGAGGGNVQAAQDVHERGLAGAGDAHDCDHFAAGDAEVHAVEGGDLHAAQVVNLGYPFEDDHGGFPTAASGPARRAL